MHPNAQHCRFRRSRVSNVKIVQDCLFCCSVDIFGGFPALATVISIFCGFSQGKTYAVSPIRQSKNWFVAQSAFHKYLTNSQQLSLQRPWGQEVSILLFPSQVAVLLSYIYRYSFHTRTSEHPDLELGESINGNSLTFLTQLTAGTSTFSTYVHAAGALKYSFCLYFSKVF